MPGPRERSQATRDAYYQRTRSGAGEEVPPPSGPTYTPGQPVVPNPDDYYVRVDEFGNKVPAGRGESGAYFNTYAYNADLADYRDLVEGRTGGGATGPTAAELAIDRSRVQSQNLATYLDGVIGQIQSDIDARRLTTEQAVGEFNRRLDAFSESGRQFQGIQPYTIPRGAEYIPGFGPGGPATKVGLEPVRASPIEYDPFGMANQIVAETPNIANIGVPSTDPLQQAIDMLKGYL